MTYAAMARGRSASASRRAGSRKLTSAAFPVRELDVRHLHVLQHVVEHAVGVHAGGQRLVGEDEPVAQHVARDIADVARQHVVAAAQQRERAPGARVVVVSSTAYSMTRRSTNTACAARWWRASEAGESTSRTCAAAPSERSTTAISSRWSG